MSELTHVCGLVIEHEEHETFEVLLQGSEEECKRFMRDPPARLIMVEGTAKDATFVVLSMEDWNKLQGISTPTVKPVEPSSTPTES